MEQQVFLKSLIDRAFSYVAENPTNLNKAGFISYLAEDMKEQLDDSSRTTQVNSEVDDLGIRLVLLNRYAKKYVKIALANTPLQTSDEFPFLVALFAGGSHIKSELFDKMLLTKTTGAEVLKRLKNKGLIEEYADPSDKRSKRVEISNEGRQLVLRLLPKMSGISELLRGNLSTSELRHLNNLLKKLSTHHRRYFEETSLEELEKIIHSAS